MGLQYIPQLFSLLFSSEVEINGCLILPTQRNGKHLSSVILFCLVVLSSASHLPQTAAPLFDKKPFVILWNAPITRCQQLKIPLDLSTFDTVTTPAKAHNQILTLFYKKRIGLFPYTDLQTLTQYNGGIPQRGDLNASLKKARKEFTQYLPDSSPGLAVMDWEEWLPLFDQNTGSRELYKKLSINYTLQQDPYLNMQDAKNKAKQQFQSKARDYMENTLKLGITERPQYLWGFYMFPDCYNYKFEIPDYTGRCSQDTTQLNNELMWLWKTSTALFPSAYMPTSISRSKKAALFVRHQIQEAIRVAALPQRAYSVPVYVYLRPLLRDQKEHYMNEVDLIRSIGESAVLGAAGCVLWGSSYDFNDKASCESLSTYLSRTLNQYIFNVTTAAYLCSNMLCQSNGRCVRRNYDTDDYLHLDPESFTIKENAGTYHLSGKPSNHVLIAWADKFTCQCYAGKNCTATVPSELPNDSHDMKLAEHLTLLLAIYLLFENA